jgi:hypothetical protein
MLVMSDVKGASQFRGSAAVRLMKIRSLAIALLIVICLHSPVAAKTCLKYGPTVVSLTGTLRSRVFPGPPNYESKKGDRKETAIILTLGESICTTGDDPQGLDLAETGVREIQLVVMKDAHWKSIRRLKGRRAKVTGTLFQANTGHHRTKVLIDLSNIRAAG